MEKLIQWRRENNSGRNSQFIYVFVLIFVLLKINAYSDLGYYGFVNVLQKLEYC